MPRRLVILIALCAWSIVSALGPACLAGTVTLRASATVNADAPITLGDIATLEGDDAAALATVVIRPGGSGGSGGPITIAEVRAALDARRVNWGRVALRGGQRCEIRTGGAPAPRAAVDPQAPPTDATDPSTAPGDRVRHRVLETLAGLFGVTQDDLRVSFDASSADLLAMSASSRRVDVQATTASSRLMVRVWVYEGDRLLTQGVVRADIRVRVEAVVLRAAISRGERVTPDHVTLETLWMEPTGAPPVRDMASALGAVSKTRLDAGAVLRVDHVEPPLVIKRGDLVSVHALAGGLTVRTKARALADAREGELVELSRARDRRPFLARASGPGIAVLESGEHASR